MADNVTYDSISLFEACTNTGTWQQASIDVTANAGHSVTLYLDNYDDNQAGTPTYTFFDDVLVTVTPPEGPPVVVGPGRAIAGQPVPVTCSGFGPGATVNITLTQPGNALSIVLDTVTADEFGNVSVNPRLPLGASGDGYVFGCNGPKLDGATMSTVSPPVSIDASGLYAYADPSSGWAGSTTQICAEGFPANDTLSVSYYGVPLDGANGSLAVDDTGAGCATVTVPADASEGTHLFELTSTSDPARYATTDFEVTPPPCIPNLISDTFSRPGVLEFGVPETPFGNEEGPCHLTWHAPSDGHDAGRTDVVDSRGFIGSGGGDNWGAGAELTPNMPLPVSGQYSSTFAPDDRGGDLVLSFNGGAASARLSWDDLGYTEPETGIRHLDWQAKIDLTVNGVTTEGTNSSVSLPAEADTAFPVAFSVSGNVITFDLGGTELQGTSSVPLTVLTSFTIEAAGSGGGNMWIDDLRVTGGANLTTQPYLAHSTVSVSPSTIVAGHEANVTVTIRDASGTPVNPSASVSLNATGGGTVSDLTAQGNGVYTGTYTGALAGPVTVGAQLDNDAIDDTANLTVQAGPAAASGSFFGAGFVTVPGVSWHGLYPLSVTPDGTAYSTLTVNVRDAYGNPVLSGDPQLTLESSLAGSSFSTPTTTGGGIYTAHLTSTAPGTATVTARIDGVAINDLYPLSPVAFPIDLITNSTISLSADTVIRGNTLTVTVQLRDGQDQPYHSSGGWLSLTVIPAVTCTNYSHPGRCPNAQALGSVTDHHDGTYTAIFDTAPLVYGAYGGLGDFAISAQLAGVPLAHNSVTLHELAGPYSLTGSTGSSWVPVGTSIYAPADGVTTRTITMTVKDAWGDWLADDPNVTAVTFNTTVGTFADNCTTDCPATNNHDGTWSVQLKSSVAGEAVLQGFINGEAAPHGWAQEVDFLDVMTNSYWTISPADNTVGADGVATYEVTLHARDADNNPIDVSYIDFTTSGGAYFAPNNVSTTELSGNNGTAGDYTVNIASPTTGPATITASFSTQFDSGFVPPFTVTFVNP